VHRPARGGQRTEELVADEPAAIDDQVLTVLTSARTRVACSRPSPDMLMKILPMVASRFCRRSSNLQKPSLAQGPAGRRRLILRRRHSPVPHPSPIK
jgi:hypothetical protein